LTRALLDVNVLIALLDADHALHQRTRDWFGRNASAGWASCPLTQNGCVRIMSHPSYPNPLPVRAVIERLREAAGSPDHEFWPDHLSLLDPGTVDASRVHGPRQVTDVYLLALAVRRDGRFATFDDSVPFSAVKSAEKKHIVLL
jgi:toxin-antitoxin system PIN domain toxin